MLLRYQGCQLMLQQAKHAYRSIAEFVQHVSCHDAQDQSGPFPQPHHSTSPNTSRDTCADENHQSALGIKIHSEPESGTSSIGDVRLTTWNEAHSAECMRGEQVEWIAQSQRSDALKRLDQCIVSIFQDRDVCDLVSPCSGKQGEPRPTLVRERVDIHGVTRPMESPEELHALNLPPRPAKDRREQNSRSRIRFPADGGSIGAAATMRSR